MSTSRAIRDYDTPVRKYGFTGKFLSLFTLDPAGAEWVPLGDVLDAIKFRPEFSYNSGYMLLWIRALCEAAGLTREDRPSGPGHVDLSEGYYGILRKE